jgi:formylglycine-generating enzyme required for sulfatase activity
MAQPLIGKGFIPDENGRRIEDPIPTVPATDDRALWDAVKDSRDVGELKVYLGQFPQGLFAALAALRVRTLEQATSPAPQSPPIAQLQKLVPGQIIKDCADCPEMVVIPAGSFEMGSDESVRERPIHRVNVTSFLIGKTEVTQAQWRAVMGSNPSRFSQCGDDCPVEQVGWIDAQEFARRLSQKTGKDYRLPSESEWEYAARAGSTTKWSFGDNGNQLGDYAWYGANSQYKTQRVAQKRSNAFGLYDMHGNVWEWVEDCWHGNYSGAPIDGSAWSTACSSTTRVLRGGSWIIYPTDLRSAVRHSSWPDSRSGDSGLRLARTP